MMPAVSQTYGFFAASNIQNATVSSAIRSERQQAEEASTVPSVPQSSEDSTTLSLAGRQLSQEKTNRPSDKEEAAQATKEQEKQTISQEELTAIAELQRRDTEVRTHEQAHLSAAGQYASGGASFSYTTGPNGKRYAEGGEVPIDLGKEKSPDATIQKMRTVRRAALAPANPSGPDRAIAAQASSIETQAMKDLQEQTKVSGTEASTTGAAEGDGALENPRANPPEQNNLVGTESSLQDTNYTRKSMTSAYQAIAALTS